MDVLTQRTGMLSICLCIRSEIIRGERKNSKIRFDEFHNSIKEFYNDRICINVDALLFITMIDTIFRLKSIHGVQTFSHNFISQFAWAVWSDNNDRTSKSIWKQCLKVQWVCERAYFARSLIRTHYIVVAQFHEIRTLTFAHSLTHSFFRKS